MPNILPDKPPSGIDPGWQQRADRRWVHTCGYVTKGQYDDAPGNCPCELKLTPEELHRKKSLWNLGDDAAAVLGSIGITPERVSKWMGTCNCKDRQEKWNRLGQWLKRHTVGEDQEVLKQEILQAIGDDHDHNP